MLDKKSPQIFYLIFLYLLIIFSKLLLVSQISSPHIVFDESNYFITSQSIWHNHTYFTSQHPFPQYPPIYSFIISPTAFFSDTETSFRCILIINSFLSTLILFPSFYLAREYLSEKYSTFIALFSAIMPASFIYTFTIMSENLFFPLFLTSVYCMVRVWKENNLRNNSLAGIFISLTVLTKVIGGGLIVVLVGEKIWQILKVKRT